MQRKKMPKGEITTGDQDLLLSKMNLALHLETGNDRKIFLEVGTHKAGTTHMMAQYLWNHEAQRVAKVVTCDLNQPIDKKRGTTPEKKFRQLMDGPLKECPVRVDFLPCSGIDAARFIEGQIVWAFLDGCHCETCIEGEVTAYSNRLCVGGFLLLHDCDDVYRSYPPDQHYHGDPPRKFHVIEVAERFLDGNDEFVLVDRTRATLRSPGKFSGGTWAIKRIK